MGSNRPESYFEKFTYNSKAYGIVDCYDGHSIDASSLTKMNQEGFSHFYNVDDGCYTEYYVICSHAPLTKAQLEKIDEFLAEENES